MEYPLLYCIRQFRTIPKLEVFCWREESAMASGNSSLSEDAIKEAVLEILQTSDLENTSEFKVRKLASEKLGFDLNAAAHKKFVRNVVDDYLSSKAEAEAKQASAEKGDGENDDVDDEDKTGGNVDEEDENRSNRFVQEKASAAKQAKQAYWGDNDDQIICQLSSKRNVSIQNFRGRTLVSIREYYEKDGELRPSAKGISLSVDQWDILKNNVTAIEKAISEI